MITNGISLFSRMQKADIDTSTGDIRTRADTVASTSTRTNATKNDQRVRLLLIAPFSGVFLNHSSNSLLEIEPIDEDDYYRKGTEFREWLRDTHGILWGELKTVVAKEYFETFCELWNKGKLSDRYYKGITSASTDASSRTRHRWNFKDVDMNQLNASSVTLNPLPKQSNFSNTQLFPTAFGVARDGPLLPVNPLLL